MGNHCCSVGERFESDGAGVSKADADGVVHGGAEGEDGVAGEIDVDGTGARSSGGIRNNYSHVCDWFVAEGGIGHGGMYGALRSSPVVVCGSEQLQNASRRPDYPPPTTPDRALPM